MSQQKTISGFSKLSKLGKIKWLVEHFFTEPDKVMHELKSYWLANDEDQELIDGFSENTISNFPLPYGVAPNFIINGTTYAVPMVIEESSVVAAASSAAKFWMDRGGFKVDIIGTEKSGQVHFIWTGPTDELSAHMAAIIQRCQGDTAAITDKMNRRGGGIVDMELRSFIDEMPGLHQLSITFETCDSMGANFINSVLEQCAQSILHYAEQQDSWASNGYTLEVIMSILSNYTPKCVARAEVSCPIEALEGATMDYDAAHFAERFYQAVRIAEIDPYRAVTHNKGIFNGIDAVVLATGNDFRAIEADGHAFAARSGQYRSLSRCSIEAGVFTMSLEVPIAVGTVGGLTSLHPIAKRSLELLGQPSARELMCIIAAVGLAQNFAAVRSLVTTGIQSGHMRLHLLNILHSLGVDQETKSAAIAHFANNKVSYAAVRAFIRE